MPRITNLEVFARKAAKATQALTRKPKKLSAANAKIASVLNTFNAPDAIRSLVGGLAGADFSKVDNSPVPGSVVFVTGKIGNRRHGHALHRPAMVHTHLGNGEVSVIRFHSGRVHRGATLKVGEYRPATRGEIIKFVKENLEGTPKLENMKLVLGL